MKNLITIFSFMLLYVAAWGQQHEETITKRLSFEKPGNHVFYLANINGEVSAEGYDGDEIIVEAKMQVKAKSDSRLNQAKKELQLLTIDRLDTLIMYIQRKSCNQFGRYETKNGTDWTYNWGDCNEKSYYDFTYDFTIKVPQDVILHLSTINNGDLEVRNPGRSVFLKNINGSIAGYDIRSTVYANTINGDVTIKHVTLPVERCYYYTLNGDIDVTYPKGLSADVTFESFNGDLFSDIEALKQLPVVVERSESTGKGISYKVDTKSAVQIRNGGVKLDFETFNGDAFIRERQ